MIIGGSPYWPYYPYTYPHPYPYAYGGYGYPLSPPIVEQAPPVYTQPPPPTAYWYYCQDPPGYYPHVSECPGGWLAVIPQPAPQ